MDPSATTLPVEGADAVPTKEKGSSTPSLHVAEVDVFDEKDTKRLLRKLDWHLLPYMSLIYLYVNLIEEG